MYFSKVCDAGQRTVLHQVLDDYCREQTIAKADRARDAAAHRLEDLAASGMHRAEDLALILRTMRG